MTIELEIEKQSKFTQTIRDAYNDNLDKNDSPSIDSLLESMRSLSLLYPIKAGRGGHHVWVSDMHNQRLAIIRFK